MHGAVWFEDGSLVNIEGCRTVLFVCKNEEHRSLTGVYFILRLTANIVSIGLLDDAGSKTEIDRSVLCLYDPNRCLLPRYDLYYLDLDIVRPVCLAACSSKPEWLWHARFGHLNFQVLRRLSQQSMVCGLPPIEHMNQVWEACLVG